MESPLILIEWLQKIKAHEERMSATVHSTVTLFYFLVFLDRDFLCSFVTCPATLCVEQAGLELTNIHLPQSAECWN